MQSIGYENFFWHDLRRKTELYLQLESPWHPLFFLISPKKQRFNEFFKNFPTILPSVSSKTTESFQFVPNVQVSSIVQISSDMFLGDQLKWKANNPTAMANPIHLITRTAHSQTLCHKVALPACPTTSTTTLQLRLLRAIQSWGLWHPSMLKIMEDVVVINQPARTQSPFFL